MQTVPTMVPIPTRVQSLLARDHQQLLINGTWRDSSDGKTFETLNPATGEALSKVSQATEADVDAAVRAARSAFDDGLWPRMTPFKRERVLRRIAEVIAEHAEEFAVLESLDNGKPILNTRRNDVTATIDEWNYFAGWPSKLLGNTMPVSLVDWKEGGQASSGFSFTVREPLGVVGAITPWNFPLETLCTKIAPALASGNTVICKPAEQTPLTAVLLGELLTEEVEELPPGVVNIVQGFGEPTGAAMAAHPGIDMLTLTGESATGQKVTVASAGNMKRLALELGGKNPFIIFADADLDAAATHAALRAFDCAGQVCIAGSRLYVEESVFEEVLERLAQHARSYRIGPGLDPATTLGPLVSREQLAKVTTYVTEGESEGAQAIRAGELPNGEFGRGFFHEPTIFVGIDDKHRINREEIFGPVVSVMKFTNPDEVIARANATEFGLMSYVWTRDLNRAFLASKQLRSGMVRINGGGGDQSLPFGGRKMSGHGREQSDEGLKEFTQIKSVSVRLQG